MDEKKDMSLTKDDKADIMRAIKDDKVDIIRAIYATSLIQYLATISSMIAIFHFMLNK